MADTENMFNRVARRQQKTSRPPTPTPDEPQPQKSAAKRQNPEYKQVGIYLKKDVHRAVKVKTTIEDIEISQLIEDLLVEWLNN